MPSEQPGNQDSQCGFANGHHVGLPLMWASRLPGDVLNAGGISNLHAGLLQSTALLNGTECRLYLYFLILCKLHWHAVNNSTNNQIKRCSNTGMRGQGFAARYGEYHFHHPQQRLIYSNQSDMWVWENESNPTSRWSASVFLCTDH